MLVDDGGQTTGEVSEPMRLVADLEAENRDLRERMSRAAWLLENGGQVVPCDESGPLTNEDTELVCDALLEVMVRCDNVADEHRRRADKAVTVTDREANERRADASARRAHNLYDLRQKLLDGRVLLTPDVWSEQ